MQIQNLPRMRSAWVCGLSQGRPRVQSHTLLCGCYKHAGSRSLPILSFGDGILALPPSTCDLGQVTGLAVVIGKMGPGHYLPPETVSASWDRRSILPFLRVQAVLPGSAACPEDRRHVPVQGPGEEEALDVQHVDPEPCPLLPR